MASVRSDIKSVHGCRGGTFADNSSPEKKMSVELWQILCSKGGCLRCLHGNQKREAQIYKFMQTLYFNACTFTIKV